MSTSIKNVLGLAGVVALLCIAASSLWYVNAFSRNTEPTSFRSFSVEGNGKATAIPDVSRFTVRVITEGDTNLGNSQNKNTEKINAVLSFIKAKGIAQQDIKTQNYSVAPRYQYFSCSDPVPFQGSEQAVKPCPPPQIVGYTVEQTIAVTVREKNFGTIGELLSGVVGKGANSVSQLSFEVDDPTAVQSAARAQAIEKAKIKAQSMAQAGGFSLGRLLSIDEGNSYTPSYDRYLSAAPTAYATEAKIAPTIEPGSQDVSVDVTLKYEIQ